MGREWYRSGRSSTKRGVGNGGERDSPSNGCMCAFLQLFDFHPFQFSLNQQHSPPFQADSVPLPQQPTNLKGVEAPRNSLESMEAAPLSSIFEEEEEEETGSLKIPMSIQIKTSGGGSIPKAERASRVGTTTRVIDLCPETSSSPGTKTPSLVARLMGIDLLPESSSPSLSSIYRDSIQLKKSQLKDQTRRPTGNRGFLHNDSAGGTRSLPETPRMSSARRSDADPRLSLQINKENVSFSEELFARCSVGRRELMTREDERSPSRYAKQIAKRIKESVTRRVGIDITNTIGNRDNRAEKSPKDLAKFIMEEQNLGKKFNIKTANPSAAKDRTPDLQHQREAQSSFFPTSIDDQSRPTKYSSKSKLRPPENQPGTQHKERGRPIQRCEKGARERFGSRLKKPPQAVETIRSKKEDPFKVVRQCNNSSERKCKRTPLSNELIVNPKTRPPVKSEPRPAKTDPEQCSQFSNYSSKLCTREVVHESTKQEIRRNHMVGDIITPITTRDGRAEAHYIAKILQHMEIERYPNTTVKWFSPSHPLNPSIFHYLERDYTIVNAITLFNGGSLTHRCSRKLVFDLTDEILGVILKPLINSSNPWAKRTLQEHNHIVKGHNLVETLCTRIRSFPLADCRVLEDIDALIDVDLTDSKVPSWGPFDDEESEGIVVEIEKDIVDSLVQDTVAAVFGIPLFSFRT